MGLLEEGITSGLGFWAYELGQQIFTNATGRSPTAGERGVIGGCTACLCAPCCLCLAHCCST